MLERRVLASLALWTATSTACQLGAQAAGHGCVIHGPLDRVISRIEASETPVIELLLRFGAENDLCIGIEPPDQSLFDTRVTISLTGMSAKNVLRHMLDRVPGYVTSADDGIIVIRKRNIGKHSWMDYRIANFKAPRATLQLVSNLLYMTLATAINPTIDGFAGHYRPGDTADQVGPFEEKGRTVRHLSNLIVSNSRGAMWIAYEPTWSRQSVLGDPFWSIFECHEPLDRNVRMLHALRGRVSTEHPNTLPR